MIIVILLCSIVQNNKSRFTTHQTSFVSSSTMMVPCATCGFSREVCLSDVLLLTFVAAFGLDLFTRPNIFSWSIRAFKTRLASKTLALCCICHCACSCHRWTCADIIHSPNGWLLVLFGSVLVCLEVTPYSIASPGACMLGQPLVLWLYCPHWNQIHISPSYSTA